MIAAIIFLLICISFGAYLIKTYHTRPVHNEPNYQKPDVVFSRQDGNWQIYQVKGIHFPRIEHLNASLICFDIVVNDVKRSEYIGFGNLYLAKEYFNYTETPGNITYFDKDDDGTFSIGDEIWLKSYNELRIELRWGDAVWIIP